jgi:hypothetical protein
MTASSSAGATVPIARNWSTADSAITPSPISCWARSGSSRIFTRAVTRVFGQPSAWAAPSSVSPRRSIASYARPGVI